MKTPNPATGAGSARRRLLAGLALALALGGTGFWVAFSGLAERALSTASPLTAGATAGGRGFVYLPIAPITINLGRGGQSRHLRFTAQIEVAPQDAAELQRQMPRILDVLNIYLRALDVHELEEPAALLRLRAQMLRRIRIVAGDLRINDLLIGEFVFN